MSSDLSYRTIRVKNGDVTIAVHEFGKAGGDPLLVLHAASFHGLAYLPTVLPLLERCHIYALDLRAHGISTAPADDGWLKSSWTCLATDVLAVLKALSLQGCYVFGHSLGATVALRVQIMNPSAFRGMYVFEPAFWPLPVPKDSEGKDVDLDKLNRVFSMAISARRHQFSSRQAALAYFQRHPAFVLLDPRVAHAYVDYGLEEEEPGGTVTLRGNAKVEGGILRAFMTCPSVTAEQLASIACPVLLGMGPHDRGGLTEFLQISTLKVAQAIPNCKLERYEGLHAHFGPLERPDMIAKRVLFGLLVSKDTELWNLLPPTLIFSGCKLVM
eukprot:jgi/Botrbrau1/1700/Bobra.116_2s0042.1